MKGAIWLMLIASPALAQAEDLADQRARLARATARINVGAGRNFAVSRRIHVDLSQRVFATWLAAVAPDGLRAAATGTSSQGDLVNRQVPLIGAFSAEIAPASGTRLDLAIANPRISAAAGRLTVTGDLTAEGRARVRVSGRGAPESVECRTRPPVRERGTATFNLANGTGGRYPFTLRLTTPDNVIASLDCDIADLRRIENVLPINSLAGQLADGVIDIGLSPMLQLPTPGAGRPLVLPLNPRRPSLLITAQGLAYSAD